MELFEHLFFGFSVAVTPQNLFYCLIGVSVGTLIGVLPGIGPLATIAMLLPITYNVSAVSALRVCICSRSAARISSRSVAEIFAQSPFMVGPSESQLPK